MLASVFDIDGTLIDSMTVDGDLYTASIKAVLGNIGFRKGWEEYEHVTDSGVLNEILADNSIALDIGLVESIKSEFLTRMEAHILEFGPFSEVPGAQQFLRSLLKTKNHKVGIATGGWRATAKLKLISAGFDISEIPLSTSDETVDRTNIMKAALRKMGNGFDRITYYGDAEWDRQACQSLGWEFRPVGIHLNGIQSFHYATDA